MVTTTTNKIKLSEFEKDITPTLKASNIKSINVGKTAISNIDTIEKKIELGLIITSSDYNFDGNELNIFAIGGKVCTNIEVNANCSPIKIIYGNIRANVFMCNKKLTHYTHVLQMKNISSSTIRIDITNFEIDIANVYNNLNFSSTLLSYVDILPGKTKTFYLHYYRTYNLASTGKMILIITNG